MRLRLAAHVAIQLQPLRGRARETVGVGASSEGGEAELADFVAHDRLLLGGEVGWEGLGAVAGYAFHAGRGGGS
jgi:hypothetical protein